VVATPGRLEDYLDRRRFHLNALRIIILVKPTVVGHGIPSSDKKSYRFLPKSGQDDGASGPTYLNDGRRLWRASLKERITPQPCVFRLARPETERNGRVRAI